MTSLDYCNAPLHLPQLPDRVKNYNKYTSRQTQLTDVQLCVWTISPHPPASRTVPSVAATSSEPPRTQPLSSILRIFCYHRSHLEIRLLGLTATTFIPPQRHVDGSLEAIDLMSDHTKDVNTERRLTI